MTGAVNQQGDIQAIAGVNEQIEGFYDVCVQRGLTGHQGVLIPQANVRHLMLRADVLEAIRQGRFHVYPITHVDQGLALLTGVPAGDLMTAGTVHALVNAQVHHFATAMLAFHPEARDGIRLQPWEGGTLSCAPSAVTDAGTGAPFNTRCAPPSAAVAGNGLPARAC